jgi:hypothetical protein
VRQVEFIVAYVVEYIDRTRYEGKRKEAPNEMGIFLHFEQLACEKKRDKNEEVLDPVFNADEFQPDGDEGNHSGLGHSALDTLRYRNLCPILLVSFPNFFRRKCLSLTLNYEQTAINFAVL